MEADKRQYIGKPLTWGRLLRFLRILVLEKCLAEKELSKLRISGGKK